MSERQRRKRDWYLVKTMFAGMFSGILIAPACGSGCRALWMVGGAGIGLLIGIVIDASFSRSA